MIGLPLLLCAAVWCDPQHTHFFLVINRIAQVVPSGLWEHITMLGDTALSLLVVAVLMRRHPHLLGQLLCAAIVSIALTHTLKPLLNFPRPLKVLDPHEFTLIGRALRNRSFPSGHTVSAFVVLGVCAVQLRSRWLRVGCVGLAWLIGISRIAVGVHWVRDVAAGVAMGWASVVAGVWLAQRLALTQSRWFIAVTALLPAIAALVLLVDPVKSYPATLVFQYVAATGALLWWAKEYGVMLKALFNDTAG
jgi:membrane-associated phospholipid phosphatase